MACGSKCCGGDKAVPIPIKVPPTDHPAEPGSSRCCSDSDAKADACCNEDCLRSIALQDCVRACGVLEKPTKEGETCSDDKPAESETCCSSDIQTNDKTQGACSKSRDAGCCTAKSSTCSAEKQAVSQSCCQEQNDKTNNNGTGSYQSHCCDKEQKPCSGTEKLPYDAASTNRSEKGILQDQKTGCCKNNVKTNDGAFSNIEPCESHLEAARRRYSNMFGAMSCMCKALLAQGLESCCSTKRRLSPERIRNAPTSRSRDKCCSSKTSGLSTALQSKRSNMQSMSQRKMGSEGCKEPPRVGTDSCCPTEKDTGKDCQSDCCKSTKESTLTKPMENVVQRVNELSTSENDVEGGRSRTEHVTLSVQGMTCTGCETKLHRSIKAIPSAINAQASIVLSRAEFDIDPQITTSEQAITHLERATGFSLTKLSLTGSEIHVKATAESKSITNMKPPLAVLDVRHVDDNTIGISYDANVVGARDLLRKSFNLNLELAPLQPPANISAGAKHVRHVGLMTILSTVLTIPVLVFAWARLPPTETAYQSASLALATIVQLVVAGPFYSSALRSLIFSRVIEMDLLIVLSTSAAYIFSAVAYAYKMSGNPLSTGEFFESSTLLVTLIMVGRFLSAFARQKAVESISITSLQPTKATLVDEYGNDYEEIDSRLLHYTDVFKVLPDSRVVTDGTVVFGESEIDESMITGESTLVLKAKGSSVVSGSVNGTGLLHVRVARLPGENTISSIADMVDRAKLSKPKIQEFADKVAGYFVPVVVAITMVVFCIWIGIGISARRQSGSDAVVGAITYAIAVLIVSCPCAVGLAVPMVIVISCGVGAEHGVVFKSAQSIESSWRASHVVFDKTGTLTQGKATVAEEAYLSPATGKSMKLLLGLVSGNKHPNSAALSNHLTQQGIDPAPLESLEAIVGKGVEGHKDGHLLRAGSAKWLGLETLDQVQAFHSRGLTTLCFSIDGTPQAVFGLKDTLRPEARSVVSDLTSRGITVSIVSGDDRGPIDSIGTELGLNPLNLKSRCTPQDKQQFIHDLTQDKKIVIFCGDGSNDAGALAQATVGVHMSEGTDVARSASDAVLMTPDISGLLKLMDISHAAFRRILLNFAWAGVYNLFAILLAAGAFVDFRIPPQYAGLGEVVSVLPVILIALQMKWVKF